MFSSYDGSSEEVSARIGNAWKKFKELGGVWVCKQSLYLKQCGKMHQSYARAALLYCSKTWEFW